VFFISLKFTTHLPRKSIQILRQFIVFKFVALVSRQCYPNHLLRYISPFSSQPRPLAPPVPLKLLLTPWASNFSSSSSSSSSSSKHSIFTASLCCGSSLAPSNLFLAPKSTPFSGSNPPNPKPQPKNLNFFIRNYVTIIWGVRVRFIVCRKGSSSSSSISCSCGLCCC
jgi:hypothetical protein